MVGGGVGGRGSTWGGGSGIYSTCVSLRGPFSGLDDGWGGWFVYLLGGSCLLRFRAWAAGSKLDARCDICVALSKEECSSSATSSTAAAASPVA